ncbi:mechanosensitive ion channel family protein [Chryseobacterium sp. StRB126]|uniref:hypothetical protein n=1 Tax=Chryseobacterium sp. StRB126 TaxID=878220 RepID=UPI0004E9916A|nr:hypothetical protein [Chryseobacterium sp. StRB126]BAP30378.1 mechanosensitive ion channel family protein [Chryseobacterium sp. StRB126]
MENNRVPQSTMSNIVISLYFTIAYAVLIGVYLGFPINLHSNFLLDLFIVCSLLLSVAGIYFAGKSYKRAKISSVILIIINSLGLLIPVIMLLMIFT